MFRDLKEYQEIAKIYAEKVSKPENLEERRGSSVQQLAQNRANAFKPATPPQKGAGGGVGNPTNVRGIGAKPRPEKKIPSTAEIRKANPNVVSGTRVNEIGAEGGGKPSSGDLSMFKDKKTETEPKSLTTKQKFDAKFIKKDKGKGFVKRGTPMAQRAEKKEAAKLKAQELARQRIKAKKEGTYEKPKTAQELAKERIAKKAAMEEYTPYDIVLEYLLSTEQVATIEEANYVMTEMDGKTIQSVVKEVMGGVPGDGYIGHPRLKIENPFSPPKKETKKTTGKGSKKGVQGLGNRATEIEDMIKGM